MKQRVIRNRSKRLPQAKLALEIAKSSQTLSEKANMALADLNSFMDEHHPLDRRNATEASDQVAGDEDRAPTITQPGMRITKIGFGRRILRSVGDASTKSTTPSDAPRDTRDGT